MSAKKSKGKKTPARHDSAGRPDKLTAELADKAVTLSVAMVPDATICRALRIHPSTWCDWKNKAEAGSPKHRELFARIEEAQAIEEIDLMAKIKGDPDWRAKMAVLERRARGYEARQKLEHTGKDGTPLQTGALPAPITIIFPDGTNVDDNPYRMPTPPPPPKITKGKA